MKIKTDFNGKTYTVEKEQIETLMKSLDLTFDEAVETYLDDEGILENEEQNALDEKAQKVYKEQSRVDTEKAKKPRKKVERKISDEKADLSEKIYNFLVETYGNVEILKKNKLFSVKIGEKILKLDLIEQRPPKK
jgi:hypothetical protein